MPSLRQLLALHAPVLVLDAASSRVQVGVLDRDGRATWRASEDEAGVAIFRCVAEALGEGRSLDDVRAFAFCDGPGSVLGIRTVAMALRTWTVLRPRPVFAYTSLALVAHALGRPEVGVIADARRESWHHFALGTGLRRLPANDVATASRELVMPEGFRHWAALPGPTTLVPYSLAELLPRTADADLLLETSTPDAFLHEEPSYVTWTPQIHRAPTAR